HALHLVSRHRAQARFGRAGAGEALSRGAVHGVRSLHLHRRGRALLHRSSVPARADGAAHRAPLLLSRPASTMTFLRYFVAGSLAFAAHLAILETLLMAGLRPPWAASAAGFVLACVVNYSLQYAWVFRATLAHHTAASRYISITLAMLGVNTAIFALL